MPWHEWLHSAVARCDAHQGALSAAAVLMSLLPLWLTWRSLGAMRDSNDISRRAALGAYLWATTDNTTFPPDSNMLVPITIGNLARPRHVMFKSASRSDLPLDVSESCRAARCSAF
jgi:hypothetical protein